MSNNDMGIDILKLSTRTHNALLSAGISTIKRLEMEIANNKMPLIRNIGSVSCTEIKKKFEIYRKEQRGEFSTTNSIRAFNFSQMLLVPAEDMKELKEKIERIKGWIRELDTADIKEDDHKKMAKLYGELIEGIEAELVDVEFPEE